MKSKRIRIELVVTRARSAAGIRRANRARASRRARLQQTRCVAREVVVTRARFERATPSFGGWAANRNS